MENWGLIVTRVDRSIHDGARGTTEEMKVVVLAHAHEVSTESFSYLFPTAVQQKSDLTDVCAPNNFRLRINGLVTR